MPTYEGTGGEGGIRTLGTGVSPYNGLANRRLQPLGHLSAAGFQQFTTFPYFGCRTRLRNYVFQLGHGGNHVGIEGFDVPVARDCNLGVPQDGLHHLVAHAHAM